MRIQFSIQFCTITCSRISFAVLKDLLIYPETMITTFLTCPESLVTTPVQNACTYRGHRHCCVVPARASPRWNARLWKHRCKNQPKSSSYMNNIGHNENFQTPEPETFHNVVMFNYGDWALAGYVYIHYYLHTLLFTYTIIYIRCYLHTLLFTYAIIYIHYYLRTLLFTYAVIYIRYYLHTLSFTYTIIYIRCYLHTLLFTYAIIYIHYYLHTLLFTYAIIYIRYYLHTLLFTYAVMYTLLFFRDHEPMIMKELV